MPAPRSTKVPLLAFDGEHVRLGRTRITKPIGDDSGRCTVVSLQLNGVAILLEEDLPFAAMPEILRHIADEVEDRLTEFTARSEPKRAVP